MNPFESDMKKSEFFLDGQSEEKSLANISERIAKEKDKTIKLPFMKALMLAASLVIIVTAGFFILRSDNSVNLDQLVSNNFQHYPNYQNLTVRGEDAMKKLPMAYLAYDKMNYEDAVDIFESEEATLGDVDNLYFGISLIGAKDYSKANSILAKINASNLNEYKSAHTYYLALSSVAIDKTSSISKFQELSKGDSQFAENASAILQSISSIN